MQVAIVKQKKVVRGEKELENSTIGLRDSPEFYCPPIAGDMFGG